MQKAHSHRNKHTDGRSASASTTLCVSVYASKGLTLEQEPDKCGLSRASPSLSHLPFHSVLTLVLMRRQGLTYIHPLTGTTTPTSTSSPTHTHTPHQKRTGYVSGLSSLIFFRAFTFLSLINNVCISRLMHLNVKQEG